MEGPPGFIQFLPRIAEKITECLQGRPKVFIRLEPAYGACDIGVDAAKRVGADTVIHVGHAPYPYKVHASLEGVRVVYVEGFYEHALNDINDLLKHIEELGLENIALAYSAQHKLFAEEACKHIRSQLGKTCHVIGEPLLGCYAVPHIKYSLKSDALVVIAGGFFHANSLGLMVLKYGRHLLKKLYQYDPYIHRFEPIESRIVSLLKKRYYVLMNALDAKRFGIIVGLKPGQYRPWLVESIVKLIRRRGGEYIVLVSSRHIPEDLDNLMPSEVDAYIVTSCPYIVFDDLSKYRKPVLTPGEARMILTGSLEPYLYPW